METAVETVPGVHLFQYDGCSWLSCKQFNERFVDIIISNTQSSFCKQAILRKPVQVGGCGYPRYFQVLLNELNFCIRMTEQVVDQFLAVKFVSGSYPVFILEAITVSRVYAHLWYPCAW